ncbi:hypothetical protein IQ266_06675 [filamentous cyanobacterium LEGE 11480]|uniref:Uncharacterized protein n=1 Tax=Romeriopsis navalis LEGE 11480 TaxID=2777977 RepID=A0A928Z2V7_9CYAN|nr:hypothetical protein [Romeriopsis navalis]MBE9029447.1 hypothetical protein [Romeriopsis navalis LEGE 11480]
MTSLLGDDAMRAVPYRFVATLAEEYGAIQCCWRESERSFTGFVAEVWFAKPMGDFAQRWASVIGYQIRTRCASEGPGAYVMSIPVALG